MLIAARLALLAGAASFLAAACSSEARPSAGSGGGQALYRQQNCANCHGTSGEGNFLGPPLRGIADHWTRAELVEFLADPGGFKARNPRLDELGAKYSGQMQPYANLRKDERGELAGYLLTL